jgi:hypothetical protein
VNKMPLPRGSLALQETVSLNILYRDSEKFLITSNTRKHNKNRLEQLAFMLGSTRRITAVRSLYLDATVARESQDCTRDTTHRVLTCRHSYVDIVIVFEALYPITTMQIQCVTPNSIQLVTIVSCHPYKVGGMIA